MMMRYMTLILGMVAAEAAGDRPMRVTGAVERFAPGEVSTSYSEVRLTLSPDGDTAVWFSRDRPGGAGGYDLWTSRRKAGRWSPPTPVPFNTSGRDFDPAFSADGRQLYFCSDRPGGAGGDDLYRVEVRGDAFGEVEWLGPAVNSAGKEFAPMLSPDGERLLFSSDRAGGAGRQVEMYDTRVRDQPHGIGRRTVIKRGLGGERGGRREAGGQQRPGHG